MGLREAADKFESASPKRVEFRQKLKRIKDHELFWSVAKNIETFLKEEIETFGKEGKLRFMADNAHNGSDSSEDWFDYVRNAQLLLKGRVERLTSKFDPQDRTRSKTWVRCQAPQCEVEVEYPLSIRNVSLKDRLNLRCEIHISRRLVATSRATLDLSLAGSAKLFLLIAILLPLLIILYLVFRRRTQPTQSPEGILGRWMPDTNGDVQIVYPSNESKKVKPVSLPRRPALRLKKTILPRRIHRTLTPPMNIIVSEPSEAP